MASHDSHPRSGHHRRDDPHRLPDSFGWAIKPGTPFGDLWAKAGDAFNRAATIEKDAAFTTDAYSTVVQEKYEVLKDQAAEIAKSGS